MERTFDKIRIHHPVRPDTVLIFLSVIYSLIIYKWYKNLLSGGREMFGVDLVYYLYIHLMTHNKIILRLVGIESPISRH